MVQKKVKPLLVPVGILEPSDEFKVRVNASEWTQATRFNCPQTFGDVKTLGENTGIWFPSWLVNGDHEPHEELTPEAIEDLRSCLEKAFSPASILQDIDIVIGTRFPEWYAARSFPTEALLRISRFCQLQFVRSDQAAEQDEAHAAAWLKLASQAGLSPFIDSRFLSPTSHHQLVTKLARRVYDVAVFNRTDKNYDILTYSTRLFEDCFSNHKTFELLRELHEQFSPFPIDELRQRLAIEMAVTHPVVTTKTDGTSCDLRAQDQTEDQTENGVEPDDSGEKCDDEKKDWTALSEQIRDRWFREMERQQAWIPRIRFIREFLDGKEGQRPKWKGLAASTENRRFQDNPEQWKAEEEELKRRFSKQRKTGR